MLVFFMLFLSVMDLPVSPLCSFSLCSMYFAAVWCSGYLVNWPCCWHIMSISSLSFSLVGGLLYRMLV